MKLTMSQIRELRAKAHPLHPLVIIGQHGLSANVHAEIEVALGAHELIKIRMPAQEKAAKMEATAEICHQHDAQLVQSIGRIIAIYRQRPADETIPKAKPRVKVKKKKPGVKRKPKTRRE